MQSIMFWVNIWFSLGPLNFWYIPLTLFVSSNNNVFLLIPFLFIHSYTFENVNDITKQNYSSLDCRSKQVGLFHLHHLSTNTIKINFRKKMPKCSMRLSKKTHEITQSEVFTRAINTTEKEQILLQQRVAQLSKRSNNFPTHLTL